MADDLEGNWEPLAEAFEPEVAEVGSGGGKKKRKLSDAGTDAPTMKKKKKKAQQSASNGKQEPEEAMSKSKKKRKKKAEKKQSKESALPQPGAPAEELGSWAKSRFSTAWKQEVKAKSLSPLEAKEMRPSGEWFAPLSPSSKFQAMLKRYNLAEAKIAAKSVGVLILCSSAERAFGIVDELKAASLKPVVLAAHGGGRKGDQIKRQALSISKGARLAIATPGRFLRLLDEDHAVVDGLQCVALDLQQDRKQRDLLSLAETRSDVLSLTRRYLLKPLEARSLHMALCGAA